MMQSIESIISGSDPSVDDLYTIYSQSIPLREQKSKNQIAKMLDSPKYRIAIIKQSAMIMGFNMVYISERHDFCLLEYMAIHPNHRNRGMGSKLFNYCVDHVRSSVSKNIVMLLEVDSPREYSDDRPIRVRRQNFYFRLGCYIVADFQYILPLVGQGPPPELDMMVSMPTSFYNIDKSQLSDWLKEIYVEVYGCKPNDPRIDGMLKYLGDTICLERTAKQTPKGGTIK